MKFYKFLPRFIQIFVVLVVLPRVANFVGLLGAPSAGFNIHELIRFPFAAHWVLGRTQLLTFRTKLRRQSMKRSLIP